MFAVITFNYLVLEVLTEQLNKKIKYKLTGRGSRQITPFVDEKSLYVDINLKILAENC